MNIIRKFAGLYILPLFVSALTVSIAMLFLPDTGYKLLAQAGILLAVDTLILWLKRRRADELAFKMYCVLLVVTGGAAAITLIITKGSYFKLFSVIATILFPLLPYSFMAAFVGQYASYFAAGGAVLFWNAFLIGVFAYGRQAKKKSAVLAVLAVLTAAAGHLVYINSPEQKYKGHGFAYMQGFSSTDFSDYMVYSQPSKLAMLDHPASLRIEEEENMPVLDGAEACYPMYASFAKNVYADIDSIEKAFIKEDTERTNGKYVSFTNSVRGYDRLIRGEADMFFGARPSEDMKYYAQSVYNDTITLTQIASEAFVFFVEADNPVTNLTTEQVKQIYSGEITNWNEVGGIDQEIVAFQRPAESGSQIMMTYFMGDTPLKEPKTYEVFDSMVGVIQMVAEYHNEKGAIGYTFRYFLEGLHQEKKVHMIAIDGVEPTLENIQNGSYPLITPVYCAIMESNDDPNVQAMLDWILSDEGQEIVKASGYAPVQ